MSSAPDIAIRLRRAAFNRALADADVGAISPILAPGVVLVAGTDSAVINGRKAQLLAWKREFAAPDRLIYTRSPEQIVASQIAPLAFEHGRWQGALASSGEVQASGTYTAKWRKAAASWVIEAELFLTLA